MKYVLQGLLFSVKVAGLGFEPLREILKMGIIVVGTRQTGRFFPST
jgi:hypothetical protein